MKKIAIAALLSTFVAGNAAAADSSYAGISLGRSSASATSNAVLTKSTDTVAGILVGYQFNRNWGIEAQYTGLGKFAGTHTAPAATFSGKTDALSLTALGILPVSDRFSIYGKLGIARAKTSASSVPAQLTGATRSAGTYGLGAQFNVNGSVGIRIGWDRYGIATTSGTTLGVKENSNVNVYSLGAVFLF